MTNSAMIEVYSPSLPKMREAANSVARAALGEDIKFWLNPTAPAVVNVRTLMGEVSEWYQSWKVTWAEDESERDYDD